MITGNDERGKFQTFYEFVRLRDHVPPYSHPPQLSRNSSIIQRLTALIDLWDILM
jgi:hypothetical protein